MELLKEQCQTQLFFRERTKGVVLTNYGEHLLHMCKVLFEDMRNLVARMSEPGTISGDSRQGKPN